MGAGASWSVAANWAGGVVPGAGDTAIFDGTNGANTSSTMNLGGMALYQK
jgi:hypothetical protein